MSLRGNRRSRVAKPELLAQQVHHVGAVGLVEHREVGTQAERAPVEPEQPVGDGVERPAPDALGLALARRAMRPGRASLGRRAG